MVADEIKAESVEAVKYYTIIIKAQMIESCLCMTVQTDACHIEHSLMMVKNTEFKQQTTYTKQILTKTLQNYLP
jgi:hypothetical protein